MEDDSQITEELKRHIIAGYGSIRAFAEENDIPTATVYSIIKNGISTASATTLYKICDPLQVDMHSLMGGVLAKRPFGTQRMSNEEMMVVQLFREFPKAAQERILERMQDKAKTYKDALMELFD